MRVLLGCEPNGFGPASKLTAVASLLTGVERIFIGDEGAYQYACRHPNCFEKFLTIDEFAAQPAIVQECHFGVMVMEPDLGFQLIQAGLPTYFLDSLLDYWILPNGIEPLARAAMEIGRLPSEQGKRVFDSFSNHERKVLAHMLARRSFAQNFPGVPERVAELQRLGFRTVELIGSMIDLTTTNAGIQSGSDGNSWSMLITLGGVATIISSIFSRTTTSSTC